MLLLSSAAQHGVPSIQRNVSLTLQFSFLMLLDFVSLILNYALQNAGAFLTGMVTLACKPFVAAGSFQSETPLWKKDPEGRGAREGAWVTAQGAAADGGQGESPRRLPRRPGRARRGCLDASSGRSTAVSHQGWGRGRESRGTLALRLLLCEVEFSRAPGGQRAGRPGPGTAAPGAKRWWRAPAAGDGRDEACPHPPLRQDAPAPPPPLSPPRRAGATLARSVHERGPAKGPAPAGSAPLVMLRGW